MEVNSMQTKENAKKIYHALSNGMTAIHSKKAECQYCENLLEKVKG